MKKLTNYTPGPRGVTMKDGEVLWIKPGAFIEVDPADVATTPDLGDKPKVDQAAEDELATLVEAARREVGEAAQAEMDRRETAYAVDRSAATDRADRAEEALEAAQTEIADLREKLAAVDADGNGAPAGSRAANPPALSNKSKAELIEIAKAEGVEVEDGATNEDIKSAIELHREG